MSKNFQFEKFFVLGAGSSMNYGFPSGSELLQKVNDATTNLYLNNVDSITIQPNIKRLMMPRRSWVILPASEICLLGFRGICLRDTLLSELVNNIN